MDLIFIVPILIVLTGYLVGGPRAVAQDDCCA